MQRSVFLAKLIGPLVAVIGVALIFNAATFRTMAGEFLQSHALIFFSGVLALTAGLAIVNLHNEWTFDWRVAVTITGWLCVVGGVIRIVFPRIVEEIGTVMAASASNTWIISEGIVLLAIGAWLSYAGYAPQPSPKRKKVSHERS